MGVVSSSFLVRRKLNCVSVLDAVRATFGIASGEIGVFVVKGYPRRFLLTVQEERIGIASINVCPRLSH